MDDERWKEFSFDVNSEDSMDVQFISLLSQTMQLAARTVDAGEFRAIVRWFIERYDVGSSKDGGA